MRRTRFTSAAGAHLSKHLVLGVALGQQATDGRLDERLARGPVWEQGPVWGVGLVLLLRCVGEGQEVAVRSSNHQRLEYGG